jgi:hypothetical protein
MTGRRSDDVDRGANDVVRVEEVVARYAPELEPKLDARRRLPPYLLGVLAGAYLAALVSWAVLGPEFEPASAAWFIAVPCWLAGLVGGEIAARLLHRGALRDFGRMVENTPWEVHHAVAERFRQDIAAHRRRTLGEGSEWHRARDPLKTAFDEANRSAAYWRERLDQDELNETVRKQLATAERLSAKFGEALANLDRRSEVLLSFFNDCEAKLAVLESSRRDYEESKRLAALSDRADELVADAQTTLSLIGRQFVTEAVRVGEALGALERAQLRDSAGDPPLAHIETVADRIIESSTREQEVLADLAAKLSGGRGA